MERPSFIGHYTQFTDEDNAHYPGSEELLGIYSSVGKKLGLTQIGVHVALLPPGRRTSFPHAESDEEEFCFVLEGNPHVWINGHLHALIPGDFVAFPAGTGIAHTFINNSNAPARLLVGGEATKKTNKIIYPMNEAENLVRKTREQYWENAPKHPMGPHSGVPNRPELHKWGISPIVTERLNLRPFELSDAEAVFDYAKNPNVARWVTWEPHKRVEDSLAFIKFAHGLYLNGSAIDPLAITLKNANLPIGAAGAFWVNKSHKIMELGVCLSEKHWGQGIALEALQGVVDHVWKTMDVVRIQSRCKLGNTQSHRIMEKLGMHYEGLQRSGLYCKGRSWDMEVFSLTL